MSSLVMGKNSAVGMTLRLDRNSKEYTFLDRNECESLLSEILNFQMYIEHNNIQRVVYLMVDRTTKVSEVTKSKINYIFPILIAKAISTLKDVTFIWPSSIFCKDENMVQNHPYLLSQNLAFEEIKENKLQDKKSTARIFFPQIYGSENYRKHQPFLYKVRDLIRTEEDVVLTNGKSSFRNFIHEYDVSRVLADSENWINETEVKCLFEESMSWFEIAETIRKSYKSLSQIYDQTNHSVVIPEYSYFNSDTLNVGKQYKLTSFQSAIETGQF